MSATTGLAGLLNRGGDWLADLNRRAIDAVNRGGAALPLPGGAPAGQQVAPVAPLLPAPSEAGQAGGTPAEAEPTPEAAAAATPGQRPHAGPDAELTHRQRLENAVWENERQQQVQNALITDPNATSSQRDAARVRLGNLTTTHANLLGQLGTELQRDEAEKERAAQQQREQAERDRIAAQQPKPGDTRTQRVTHNGVTAVITERYQNGQWSYVPNSAQPEGGLLGQQDPRTAVDLQTSELNLRIAQQKFQEATSPEAKEQARLALELAQFNLDRAKQEAGRADRPQIIQPGTGRVITTRNPVTGEITTQPNPSFTPEQAEIEQLTLENLRRGTLPQNAYAALQQETSRIQAEGRQQRDRLQELQRQGAISESQAAAQWQSWLGPREAQLQGLRAATEEAQRKEQMENEALQRAENQRAELLNRQREQLGYQAGEQARQQIMALAPQIRTPQFLSQFGATVERMGQRAGAPSAEAAAALPSGSTFTKDTFDPRNFAGVVPNFDAVAKAATERAIASIAPTVAARIGFKAPPLPTGDVLSGMLSQIPYRGGLSALPSPTSGLLPTPGMEALDLAGERPGWARTHYGPTGGTFFDWQLPGGA